MNVNEQMQDKQRVSTESQVRTGPVAGFWVTINGHVILCSLFSQMVAKQQYKKTISAASPKLLY